MFNAFFYFVYGGFIKQITKIVNSPLTCQKWPTFYAKAARFFPFVSQSLECGNVWLSEEYK